MAIALIGMATYVTLQSPPPPAPEDTELAQNVRKLREGPAPPSVVYVPVPAEGMPPGVSVQSQEGEGPEERPLESPPAPLGTLDRQGPPPPEDEGLAAAALPESTPLPRASEESEVDIKRRVGAERFDHDIQQLSRKADQADIAYSRFVEGCRRNIRTVTAVAGVADRDWIALAGVNVTEIEWALCANIRETPALAEITVEGGRMTKGEGHRDAGRGRRCGGAGA